MRSWDLKGHEVRPHEPQILSTAEDARTILLHLPAGEELQEHEVHENARLVVVDGAVEVRTADGDGHTAPAGHMLEFAPGERRAVVAANGSDARLLLLLSPWPGEGHPGAMSLEEKSSARERAAEHSGAAE